MNDFTKEELLIFRDALNIYLRTPSPIEAEHLRDNLQSLIDNYCDHVVDYCDYCGLGGCEKCKQPCAGELMDY